VIRVLEDVLPARFGGGSTHYQPVEHEAKNGAPRLALLVRPTLGPLENDAMRDALIAATRTESFLWRVPAFYASSRAPEDALSGEDPALARAAPPAGLTYGGRGGGTTRRLLTTLLTPRGLSASCSARARSAQSSTRPVRVTMPFLVSTFTF
jgi:hypothetical protein